MFRKAVWCLTEPVGSIFMFNLECVAGRFLSDGQVFLSQQNFEFVVGPQKTAVLERKGVYRFPSCMPELLLSGQDSKDVGNL